MNNATRPRIGVTLSANGSSLIWLFHKYSIWRAGGHPVKVTADNPIDVKNLNGLVIGGGDDISFHLGKDGLNPAIRYDLERDHLESEMAIGAMEMDMPILGICRGAQMLNLVAGGSLFEDLSDIKPTLTSRRTILPRKAVEVNKNSKLFDILKVANLRVNTLHHQAVNELGEGLSKAACDNDSVVQAVENKSKRFLIGVQWHPELLPYSKINRRLFDSLVTESA